MYGHNWQPPQVLYVCECGSVAEPGRVVVIIDLNDTHISMGLNNSSLFSLAAHNF